jgi:aspartyl-tRNA(Asn)/glutamyl-tRNA(Gln) amidotransferase subunit B
MEQGSMRADVNVSVRKPGQPFGTRTETKNVNSVRFIMAAIEYEANRQVDVLESGGAIVQETRLFDPDKIETRPLRSKEEAHDYRYFPDPDLLPLELSDEFLAACRESLPSSPTPSAAATRKRLGSPPTTRPCSPPRSRPPAGSRPAAESSAQRQAGATAPQASNWVISDLFGALNRLGRSIENSPGQPRQGAELLALIADGTLSGSLAKQVFEIMLETGQDPGAIVEERGLKQTSDTGAIEQAIAGSWPPIGQGRRISRRQGQAVRLLRRPDDEGDGRQGQSAGRQRAAQEGAVVRRSPRDERHAPSSTTSPTRRSSPTWRRSRPSGAGRLAA